MSQRIFDQLDRLERGAQIEARPAREEYNDSSAEFSAFEGGSATHRQLPTYYDHDGYGWDDYDQPLTLDSFDERLLRQPDLSSRQEQALRGNARITLPPVRGYDERATHNADPDPDSRAFQRPTLSQFGYEGDSQVRTSSSPFNQPLRSSPAFHASQRRPAPLNLGRLPDPFAFSGRSTRDVQQSSRYEPVTAREIDAEIEEHGREESAVQLHPLRAHIRRAPSAPNPISDNTGPPVVQGIQLVPTHTLPDRFRELFPYPLFNAVQSKCFNTLYKTNDNFVLSAPTGSGKTAALELAICRLINGFAIGSYKIVYQAPTKSLCSERYRDWQAKFGALDLQCVELTGDTDNASQRNVQHATIIITTPEKWDSMTRKWKDHQKLVRMVKLFLIDEVHILKEDRGATLEAVVSRMKSVGSDVRFIALSATVPNSEDIATWLGQNPMNQGLPAPRERFGEEFRPVRLQKHVVGYQSNGNDFAFDKTLNTKLPEVITKWSQRKPIMVFCFTRSSCVDTAKALSNWWATREPRQRYWSQPRQRIAVSDKDLLDTVSSGVAFHHAGLSLQDRNAVEQGYLKGEISVICCTSTLAVGVNLPCHMVIVKNTVCYQSSGCKEYSDLETMQMLGRAGRPQFDDSAVAVIMTKLQRVPYYEKMITGQEVLESCLHLNLIEHLNAEIGLGTITNASSAKKWLSGTFLYVRLSENPEHYKIEGTSIGSNLDERVEDICTKGLVLLQSSDLIAKVPQLHCTEFGDAMARYYLQFDTMKVLLALPPKAKVSEILSVIAQAAEFKEVRFRSGERAVYKDLNKNTSIKFPLPGTVDSSAQKVSLVIQSVLGGIDLPSEDYKIRTEYNTAKSLIFSSVSRLVRCIIDCQLYLEDSVTARNALALARSLGAQVWDDSPLHIKQLDGLGPVYVRKLVGAGIKSIDDLENTEAHRIETVLTRNPPFGTQILDRAKAFPKLRVSIQMVGQPAVKHGQHVTVKLKAQLGFLNDKVPLQFQRKPVYICLLVDTSDGHVAHFARMSAKKLDKGQDVLFGANLTSAAQSIRAYAMCDEIAGTLKHATLKPDIPASAFPAPQTTVNDSGQRNPGTHARDTAKRRISAEMRNGGRDDESDEFGVAGLDDADLAQVELDTFVDIDDLEDGAKSRGEPPKKKHQTSKSGQGSVIWQPTQLANGKWACNHTCKDKTQCKHMCCREGVDKPKQPKSAQDKKPAEPHSDPKQTQLGVSVTKKSDGANVTRSIETPSVPKAKKKTDAREAHALDKLHSSIKTKTPRVPLLGQGKARANSQSALSFLPFADQAKDDADSTDYGGDPFESNDLPSVDEMVSTRAADRKTLPQDQARSNIHDEDEEMLDLEHMADRVDDQSQPGDPGTGKGYVDPSPCTKGQGSQGHDLPATSDEPTDGSADGLQPAIRTTEDKDSHLFVGYSLDSAADDLGLSNEAVGNHPALAGASKPQTSGFSRPGNSVPSRKSSAQLREDEERRLEGLSADELIGEIQRSVQGPVEDDAAERDVSPDELKRWAMEEFGTEHFNFTW